MKTSGTSAPNQPDHIYKEDGACVELYANIDDQSAETLALALTRALDAGALDAWFTPIQMKKNRPAVLFTVLARKEDEARFAELILRETSTLGVRVKDCARYTAERDEIVRETVFGSVRYKRKFLDGRLFSERPESDELERIARDTNLPIQSILTELQKSRNDPRE